MENQKNKKGVVTLLILIIVIFFFLDCDTDSVAELKEGYTYTQRYKNIYCFQVDLFKNK